MKDKIASAKELATAPFGRRNLLAGLGLGAAAGALSGAFPSTATSNPAYALDIPALDAEAILVRINEISVYISAKNFPNIDPTGVEDSTKGIRAAMGGIAEGSTVIFAPGRYKMVSGSVNAGKKNITISGYGVTFVQAGQTSLFTVQAEVSEWGTAFPVTIMKEVVEAGANDSTSTGRKMKVTTATRTGFKRGQLVKIISDDENTDAATRAGTGVSRLGEYAVVESGDYSTIYLTGRLRETYTNNIRILAVPTSTIRLQGFEVVTENVDANYGGLITLTGLYRPVVKDIRCSQAGNQVVQVNGCFGYLIDNLDVGYAVNRPAPAVGAQQLGYAVLDNSGFMGVIQNSNMRFVRHAYTDDTARTQPGEAKYHHYGRSYGNKIINCHSLGTSGTAFDTHHGSEGIEFIECTANGGGPTAPGFALRGKRHRLVNCKAVNMHMGLHIFTEDGKGGESYGHIVENFTAMDCFTSAVSVNIRPDGHPLVGVRVTEQSVYIDGLIAINCRMMVYSSNAFVHVKGFNFVASEGTDNAETAILRTMNSYVTLESGLVDYTKNVRGNLQYIIAGSGTDENPVLTELYDIRVKHTTAIADRAPKFLAGGRHKVKTRNVTFDAPFTGTMPGDFVKGSSLRWSVDYTEGVSRSDLDSTFYYYSDESIGKELLSVWCAEERDILIQINPKAGNYTFLPFPAGRMRGQKLTFWSNGSGTAKILNGTATNVANINSEDRIINMNNMVVYMWDGFRWRETAFQA